jgi:hypothetical protein
LEAALAHKTPIKLRKRIRQALAEMYRRPQYRRAHGTRAKMTPALKRRIKRLAKLHPRWTQQHIAESVNVTNARVSEILHPTKKKNASRR